MSNTNFMGRDLRIDTVRHKENTVASGDPVQGCWFCLSSEKADVNLIVSIGIYILLSAFLFLKILNQTRFPANLTLKIFLLAISSIAWFHVSKHA